MENDWKSKWPEIVFASSDGAESQAIRRALKKGELRKLAPRIYSTNLVDTPAEIIRRHHYAVLNNLYPGAVISHRSAIEGGITNEGLVILTYKYQKKISLPGLTIRLCEGPGALTGDTHFMDSLYIASRPRAILENLQISKGHNRKTLSQEKLEELLETMCRVYGEDSLITLREQAKILVPQLQLEAEYQKLDQMIGTILGTQKSAMLKTMVAKARSHRKPYDQNRINLFAELFAKLNAQDLPLYPDKNQQGVMLQNCGFFEAYFSNFIEGTEFTIQEAEEIVFKHKILESRPMDAHDIFGTYEIVSDMREMRNTPNNVTELIDILQHRHHVLMSARVDKRPGEFKNIENRAGSTVFVVPELVKGTLEKGFDFYSRLDDGIKKAVFMMFFISEIHPFLDGNGRIARIMMNAELVNAEQSRIIIPTVYREDYMLSLKALSRSANTEGYIHMLTYAQKFTAGIDFIDYQKALYYLQACGAFKSSDEGKLTNY